MGNSSSEEASGGNGPKMHRHIPTNIDPLADLAKISTIIV